MNPSSCCMEMRAMVEIVLDGQVLQSPEDVHDRFAQALDLPEWYGRNLDALFDLLCDLLPVRLIFDHTEVLEAYGQAALETFRDAAKSNPGLELVFEDQA